MNKQADERKIEKSVNNNIEELRSVEINSTIGTGRNTMGLSESTNRLNNMDFKRMWTLDGKGSVKEREVSNERWKGQMITSRYINM